MSKYTKRGRLQRTDLHFGVPSGRVGRAIVRALGGHVPRAGEVLELEVEHDVWCLYLRGGKCCCEPEARVQLWFRPQTGAAS